jgi:hypothetical protein
MSLINESIVFSGDCWYNVLGKRSAVHIDRHADYYRQSIRSYSVGRPLSRRHRRLRRIFCRLAAAEKNAAKPALAAFFSQPPPEKFGLATIVNQFGTCSNF